MPVSKAWVAYQLFRKLSRAFQEPDLSETYHFEYSHQIKAITLELIKPHPVRYCYAERPAQQDPSDHQGRCACDLRVGIVKRRRDAFRRATATWNQMKADAYKGALDHQDKMTHTSLLMGLFTGLKPLFNGPLTYG